MFLFRLDQFHIYFRRVISKEVILNSCIHTYLPNQNTFTISFLITSNHSFVWWGGITYRKLHCIVNWANKERHLQIVSYFYNYKVYVKTEVLNGCWRELHIVIISTNNVQPQYGQGAVAGGSTVSRGASSDSMSQSTQ